MRSLFAIAIVAALLLTCSTTGVALAKDFEWYREHGVTIVNPPGAAPMSFQGLNGQPKGYIVDVWKKWSEKTGIPVFFRFAPWPQTLRMVKDGEVDLHGGLFRNDERAAYLDFSRPYHELKSALLVSRDKDTKLDKIYANYAIGVLDKGYAEYFLRKEHPEAKLVPLDTIAEIAEALVAGKIEALAGDHPVMGYEVGNLGHSNKLIVKTILYTQFLHAATAKGNETLIKLVDQGFSEFSTTEHELLGERWFVTEAEETHWLRDTILILAILLSGVFVFFLYDSWHVRKRDEEAEEDE
ncbi:transporter substrate-binding domain-containing protein [Pseudodesulfovibrio sp. zrk46]|uniref:transporter substrate-binding domain-containing protein n=1 Tax=Pseudodesulfovibrio sp. zrk46 TaxID=2725288 RepID=UPI0014493147|nr:transporter substrate-binding domain-containing protein [Pseudodesulfovibrio sp. zrk46]QJB55978.1 transporter substrate-binding domain-containing protein [Pseudodesulfovibrio sp. zrk46]